MQLNLLIPLVIISLLSLIILVLVWRKFAQLKRLPLENTNGNGSFVANFFPELSGFLGKLNLAGYKNKVLKETEKSLRVIRLLSLKMDSATNSMIHKIKQNDDSNKTEKTEEEPKIDFQAEEEKLITAISEEPKNPVLYKKLGNLYFEMENLNDAAEAFKVCLELDTTDIESRAKLKEIKATLAQR